MDGCPRLEKVIGRSAVADDEVIFPFVLFAQVEHRPLILSQSMYCVNSLRLMP
jgi:hypothetical protein